MEDLETFVRNADAVRQGLGWTKKELADRSGNPDSAMSKILKGKRNITVGNASDIAKALGVPLSHLFSPLFIPEEFILQGKKIAQGIDGQ